MSYILSFIVAFGVTFIAGQILVPLLQQVESGAEHPGGQDPPAHVQAGNAHHGRTDVYPGDRGGHCDRGLGRDPAGNFIYLFVYLFALVFGAIGFVDDFQKLRHHANEGLTALQKFLLQLAAAVAFTVLLRNYGYLTPSLYIPFFNVELAMPWVVYMIFAAFVMVATVNAVNLTDGIDGLATGVTIPVALFYVAVSAWFNRSDLTVVSAALAGGLSAFLIYNFHPAKVFMGDTGSLFLGGAVCGLAFALDVPLSSLWWD